MTEKPELRLLQVYSNLGIGGAEAWLIALLRHFRATADDLPVRLNIHIFLTQGKRDVLDAEAEALGATLHYSTFSRTTLFQFVRDWRRTLRLRRFHAIHDHQEFSAGIRFLMGTGHLPPVRIAHLHNPTTHSQADSSASLRSLAVKTGNQLIARLGTHILGTSRQVLDAQGYLSPQFKHLIREAVHCGFDTNRFAGNHHNMFQSLCSEFGFPPESRILLFVGRLDPQKNPQFALQVAKICIERNHRIRLLIAGSGEAMEGQLQERVQEWGLSQQIRFIGSRDDVARLMLGSQLFLFPSIAEGLGMVVVEAQAAGLPLLVSDAVPVECVVVPSLVRFKALRDGPCEWANLALQMVDRRRPSSQDTNSLVRRSTFSIERSATHLLEIYSGGLRT